MHELQQLEACKEEEVWKMQSLEGWFEGEGWIKKVKGKSEHKPGIGCFLHPITSVARAVNDRKYGCNKHSLQSNHHSL